MVMSMSIETPLFQPPIMDESPMRLISSMPVDENMEYPEL